jgi:hypothetical protein
MSVNTPQINSESGRVTAQEALTSGALIGKRALDARETRVVSDFIRAHKKAASQAASGNLVTTKATQPSKALQASAVTQVDAKELAAAVSLRGNTSAGNTPRPKDISKHRAVYKTFFTNDQRFLSRDIESTLESLSTGGKSLCDLSRSLKPQEVALRKFLLLSMIEEGHALGAIEARNLSRLKASLLQSHGKYIAETMAGFDLTRLALDSGVVSSRIGIREYAKAFQVLGDNQQDLANPHSLLALFRALKKSASDEGLYDNINTLRNKLKDTLTRESTQYPSRATAFRQHLISSQLNQLRTLGNLLKLHTAYKNMCVAMKINNLPSTSDLVDLCIRIVSGDVASGVSELVRVMAAVHTRLSTVRNAISSTYINAVLKHPVLASLYRNPAQQLQMVDQLNKNLVPGAVLSAKMNYGN